MAKSKGGSKKPAANGKPHVRNGKPERLGSYFLSLTLENVRCFGPKQTLDLSDGNGKPARWTVIFGLNGTGKTTVLQSLVVVEPLSRSKGPLSKESLPRFVNLSRVDQGSFYRGNKEETGTIGIETCQTQTITHPPFGLERSGLTLFSGGGKYQLPPWLPTGEPRVPVCYAYGASRRVSAIALGESEIDDPTSTLFSDKSSLRNAEEWLLQLDYASKSSKTQEQFEVLQHVKVLLLNVMPDDELTDIRFVSTGGTHPTARVEFKTPYGWVPLRQLGYGYQTLITWVTDLASRIVERYPDSPDPLAEPAVVLVDEIDLHLHPVWQRKLMGFLTTRFPNTQFIVTAHSPLVAQAAADANLAVLQREGDHVVIKNDVDYIRNWRVDQILTSELFGLKTTWPPRLEPLFAEREKILTKPKLTKADEKRLAELDEEVGGLSFGETPDEIKSRASIQKTLDMLLKERNAAQ
jgi:hypothetical protein